jgi:hypothetical protein
MFSFDEEVLSSTVKVRDKEELLLVVFDLASTHGESRLPVMRSTVDAFHLQACRASRSLMYNDTKL